MDEDGLKRLLEAETKAEALVAAAETERDGILDAARRDAQALRDRFQETVPQLRTSLGAEAEDRARQRLAERRQQHEAECARLRDHAEARADDAIRAAYELLVGGRRP